MAQLVEQRIRNAQVIGSNPITSSTKPRIALVMRGFYQIVRIGGNAMTANQRDRDAALLKAADTIVAPLSSPRSTRPNGSSTL